MIAIQYMGTNRMTMEEFWPLATDEAKMISEDDMLSFLRAAQAEYDENARINQEAQQNITANA